MEIKRHKMKKQNNLLIVAGPAGAGGAIFI